MTNEYDCLENPSNEDLEPLDEYLESLSAKELEEKYFDQTVSSFLSLPKELAESKRWIFWKKILRKNKDGSEKWTKPPCNRFGQDIDCYDSQEWHTLEDALQVWKENQDTVCGLGFVFTPDLGLVAIDLDSINTRILDNPFNGWLKKFNSYVELSQSMNGLHIIVKGKKPGTSCKKGNVEIYDKHYFAITANMYEPISNEIREAQDVINEFYKTYFPDEDKTQEKEKEQGKPFSSPVFYSPVVEDQRIIEVATRARNGQKFLSLMAGNISGYPSQSDADLALCSILAFYTQDVAQIERIFSGSGLCREKWNRADYRKSTVEKAINNTFSKFDWSKPMNLDEKLAKKLVKSEVKKTVELVFENVLEMTEKAYKITIQGAQIGLNGLVSVWIPKSEIKDYLEEKSSFVIESWLFGKLAEKAKAV